MYDPITNFRGYYGFLSNFYMVPVRYDGIFYPSSEHAYQAAKFRLEDTRVKISKFKKPFAAKHYARFHKKPEERVEFFDKLHVMECVLKAKFSNISLARRLESTYPRALVEGNTWGDTYWGVSNGYGDNHLGKLLMKVRDKLLAGEM